MTLNNRNKTLLSITIISAVFLVAFLIGSIIFLVKGNASSIPEFTRVISFNSDNFLLKNNPIASICSILVILLFISISTHFLYISFEKTKSPELIYLIGFFIACLLQTVKILAVFFKLWELSSNFLILIGRIELIGRIFAPISLLFTAMFSDLEKLQESDKNIGMAFLISLFCAGFLPINYTKIFSNFTLACGFISYINFYTFLCAIITVIAFAISSKQRGMTFLQSPTLYFILMFLGYMLISITDNFLELILGTIFLAFGFFELILKIHKFYLWK